MKIRQLQSQHNIFTKIKVKCFKYNKKGLIWQMIGLSLNIQNNFLKKLIVKTAITVLNRQKLQI